MKKRNVCLPLILMLLLMITSVSCGVPSEKIPAGTSPDTGLDAEKATDTTEPSGDKTTEPDTDTEPETAGFFQFG